MVERNPPFSGIAGSRKSDALQDLARQLTEKPAGIAEPFPAELSKKPLMDLVVDHLHEGEISLLWTDAELNAKDPALARRIRHLHDTYVDMPFCHVPPEDAEAAKEFAATLEKQRIFPQMRDAVRQLAKGPNPDAPLGNMVQTEIIKNAVSRRLPGVKDMLGGLISTHEIMEGFMLEPGLKHLVRGGNRLIDAHIIPDSPDVFTHVGKSARLSAEELAEEQKILVGNALEHQTLGQIAREALEQLGKLEKLLIKGASRIKGA